ncbi:MAG TPA: cyclic nucleotide-binding domain-containing protein [Thermomicrobiales bacterium]|jgi:CRP-like cAMP-binding protein
MDDVAPILAHHPFFADMPPDHLQAIAGCASGRSFAPDQFILREGEYAATFYLLRQGVVLLENHVPGRGPITVQTLTDGDVLGWSWLFPPYRWHFDARVIEAVTALEFNGACLRQQCDDDPVLGYDVMKRVAQTIIERLQATRLQFMDYADYALR